jgi:hypothetical protein
VISTVADNRAESNAAIRAEAAATNEGMIILSAKLRKHFFRCVFLERGNIIVRQRRMGG